MLLLNVSLYGKEGLWNVGVLGDRIRSIVNHSVVLEDDPQTLDANGAVLLPGFINSHDHLEFNAFPAIANRMYGNYKEWGDDIHQNNKSLIDRVQKIPLHLRVRWGLYKNLLNGFTTVVNHGNKLQIEDQLVHVVQGFPSIHSVSFEKNWKRKIGFPSIGRKGIVMHLGEGIDEMASREIGEVIRANFLKRKIIAVHGIAMNALQAARFQGLIWCPASNYLLFGRTADIPALNGKTRIVFGTDSTLTSGWNAWEHFHRILNEKIVAEEELMAMVTEYPAKLWELPVSGKLEVNAKADLILARQREDIFGGEPEDLLLVLQNGRPRLVDRSFVNVFRNDLRGFSVIRMGDDEKAVQGDLPLLIHEMKKHYPELYVPFEPVNA